MKLRYSPTSPYSRKVRVLAIETGLMHRIEPVVTNPWAEDHDLLVDNPLGKVPTLVTDDGETLYDSPVICEYLDNLHQGTRLIPPAGPARWQALREEALCDGILDAAVLRRLESQRPAEQQSSQWDGQQLAAIYRALDALEHDMREWSGVLTIGTISAACTLGYLDFRKSAEDWRERHPALAAWYDTFSRQLSMRETEPQE
ncbi:MAG: glutathione S-transferase N-terminal domain-containing protein [Pseudomonadota bacterium]|nr:MAG: glutathione S-transferase N-terminal domain-containing protein [Pseudomonadota bacterium]